MGTRPPDEELHSSFDVQAIAEAAARSGYVAEAAEDAGSYLCNAALYTSLECRGGACTFIHLPQVGNEVQGGGNGLWSLADLEGAVGVA